MNNIIPLTAAPNGRSLAVKVTRTPDDKAFSAILFIEDKPSQYEAIFMREGEEAYVALDLASDYIESLTLAPEVEIIIVNTEEMGLGPLVSLLVDGKIAEDWGGESLSLYANDLEDVGRVVRDLSTAYKRSN